MGFFLLLLSLGVPHRRTYCPKSTRLLQYILLGLAPRRKPSPLPLDNASCENRHNAAYMLRNTPSGVGGVNRGSVMLLIIAPNLRQYMYRVTSCRRY
jgi:hypothetical protein